MKRPIAFGSSAALHATALVAAIWSGSGLQPRIAATRTQPVIAGSRASISVFTATPDHVWAPQGLNPLPLTPDAPPRLRDDEPSELSLPDFTIDIERIADRALVLFPFLSPGLALERFGLEAQDPGHAPLRNPMESTPVDRSKKPRLALPEAVRQALVDGTWSRHDRWHAFQPILELVDRYDGNSGDLPALLQAYLDHNGLQLYADTAIRDPRLWTQLGLAADHVSFVGFVSRYVTAHRSSKAAIQLLFFLDMIVQASHDALVVLLDTHPGEQLQWTAGARRDAFELILHLQRYYRRELERRRLATPAGLRGYHDGVRLTILSAILRHTPGGYRASDARFLMGAIAWSQGRRADALQTWRAMTLDADGRYATAIAELHAALAAPAAAMGQSMPLRVEGVLRSEYSRWRMATTVRLRQFQYSADSYAPVKPSPKRLSPTT